MIDSDYNIPRALEALAANPRNYITAWTPEEKEQFNHGFRKFSGSRRMITKTFALTKNFQQVVD